MTPNRDDEHFWATELDAWVRYFAVYVEGFGARFAPASEDDIRRLEMRAGFAFPPELRAFLRRLGRTPHGAAAPFMEDYDFGIDVIATFYGAPTVPAPPGAVYLWTLDRQSEMFLDTTQSPPFPVVGYEWGFDDEGQPIPGSHHVYIYHHCHSLMQFLYCEAFRFLRTEVLPHRAELRRSTARKAGVPPMAARMARFRELAERLGFAPVPYMTGELAYYNRSDASLMLYPSDVSYDSVSIDADSERELRRLREILVDQLDMHALR
ncbi:SMI1/KNR4 family protein [Nannocystis sp. ILAH1]|uniref:SMI1/KNR4 family protein n=1 Tax=Nannocystis sp. ILAH1 TaxID=2996789 RepID=UPI002272270B|nr:SMI1/KNR4 family protein [Nannocystis sp. ILAH1]MCY0989721.1 SMI1/KNR4 family protein [Nannocystis sp. ILAH1]MCY0993632.1 SMI1/KNR4 family protein [Nannocystis sp. ILAH1]